MTYENLDSRCCTRLRHCKQFDELWNIVQEKRCYIKMFEKKTNA